MFYKGKRIPCESTWDGSSYSLYEQLTREGCGGTTFYGTSILWPHTEDVPEKLILYYDKWIDSKSFADWIIRHEFGHAVDFSLYDLEPESYEKMDSKRSALFNAQKEGKGNGLLTDYSGENDLEYFAEGFASFFSSKEEMPGKPEEDLELIEWHKNHSMFDGSQAERQLIRTIKQKQSATSELLKEKDPGLYSLIEDTVKETVGLNNLA